MDIFGDDDDDDKSNSNSNSNSDSDTECNGDSLLDSVYNDMFTICMRIKATCYRTISSDKGHRITLSKKLAIICTTTTSSNTSFIKRLKDAKFSNVDVYSIDSIPSISDDDNDDDSLGKVYDVVIVLGLVSTTNLRAIGIALESMLMPGGYLISTITSISSITYDTIFYAHDWVLDSIIINQNVPLTRGQCYHHYFYLLILMILLQML